MRRRVYSYESDGVAVHWDYHRCIHVEACIHSLPEVFDFHRRPWIDPTQAAPDQVAWACEQCPTGALHYERRDGGPPESTPPKNEIVISSDGPLFVQGDLRIVDADGEVLLEDTRVALCRCGRTRNKPLCDGGHDRIGFEAEGALAEAHAEPAEELASEGGELLIRAADPGPLTIRGAAEIRGDQSPHCAHVRIGALCCCGKSKNKPFCDGSHAED